MANEEIVNRVANSSLVTFDLEELYQPGERIELDIKDQLYEELILKETDFRAYVKNHDWSQYQDKHVAITCSADAIVPTWAYMLLSAVLRPFARSLIFGSLHDLENRLFQESLEAVDWSRYEGAKVVVKGCSKIQVPVQAYVEVVSRLQPIVSSIMYGEPCSTVPIYKKPRSRG